MNDNKLWEGITHQLRASCANFDLNTIKRHRRFDTYSIVSSVLELASGPDRSYLNVMHDFNSEENSPAASSFCNARKRVPAYIFSEIRQDLLEHWSENTPKPSTWFGFDCYALDGSKLNLPIPLAKQGFHVRRRSFYPHGLVTGLLRLNDRMIYDLDFSSHQCERQAAKRILVNLNRRDLVIYDKGYFSYDMLSLHAELGVQGLFQVQAGPSFKEIVEFRKSTDTDKIVRIYPSKDRLRKARKGCPEREFGPIDLRLIKYKIEDQEYLLATTVLTEDIPAEAFVELYFLRWKIEELYKSLKCTLKLEDFHSKNANGVEQEIHAASIIWNLTRSLEGVAPPDFKKKCQLLKTIAIPS